jgi:diacylglycerol kinase (ATP)
VWKRSGKGRKRSFFPQPFPEKVRAPPVTSYLLIVNPASGRGRARLQGAALERGLSGSAHVEIVESGYRGAAAEIAAGRAGEVDRIIAVGGDGTLNEVLSGLMNSGLSGQELPELGFLPSGTANAAIQAFGFSSDPGQVANSLPEVESRAVDVGIVSYEGGERPFLLWFGAGFDAVVMEALDSSRTGMMGVSGILLRLPRVLGALGRYPSPKIAVEIDGSSQGVASSVILANVKEVAFGGVVAEAADPFDGQLDVVVVPPGSRLSIVRLAYQMMKSSLTRAHGVRHSLGTRVRLASDSRVPFQLDGEAVGQLPVTVRLERGAVRLLLT